MSEGPSERELAFATRTKAVLKALAEVDADTKLDTTLRRLAMSTDGTTPPLSRPRRFGWPALAAAMLFGAIVAATVAWLIVRPAPAPAPMAFDGALGPRTPKKGPTVSRDAQGRVSTIATLIDGQPDGERVLFRAGQVVRIEHWQNGRLHGVTIDFDGAGRPAHLETWHEGELRGPTLDLDPQLRPRTLGAPP